MEKNETAVINPETWTDILPLEKIFNISNPLEIDVGCGKGRFLLRKAAENPDVNFLGIERQLKRVRKINRKIVQQTLSNVKLLKVEASYAISFLLPSNSVSTFYIFFPDPWPKRRHHSRRLYNPFFLDSLWSRLVPDGKIHTATDHLDYFKEISRLFENDKRFEQIDTYVPSKEHRTWFEDLFIQQGCSIGRASFRKL